MEYAIVFKMTCFDVLLKPRVFFLKKTTVLWKIYITDIHLEQPKKRLTIDVPSQVLLNTVLLLEPDVLGVFCQFRVDIRPGCMNWIKNPQLAAAKYFG